MALQELLILIISTVILAKSASLVVTNASKLARFFRVSQLAIGLLLISVTTSLPELSVSVISSAAGEGAIAAGNVFGSNIANVLLVLGLGAIIYGLKVSKKILPDIGLALLLTTIISAYIILHSQVFGDALGFYEGLLLLIIGAWYAFRILGKKTIEQMPKEGKLSMHEGFKAFLFFGAGVLIVIISSSFVVGSAVQLANIFGLAKSFIGATIIAIGTSLPEISIDLQALRRKEYGLAIGDAIGSNMANLTLVLGAGAAISPMFVQLKVFMAALLFAVVANIVFFYLAAVNKRVKARGGFVMLALYVIYLATIFFLQFSEVQGLA